MSLSLSRIGCALLVLLACDDTQFGASGGSSIADSTWGDEPWCQVQRVFIENCTHCHGGTSPSLEGSEAHENLVNQESPTYAGVLYVVPGDAEGSYLYQKIVGTHGEMGAAMPLGTDGLDSEQAQPVYDWIEAGAPTECGSAPTDTGPSATYHPDGWAEREVHGQAAKHQEDECMDCHGEDLAGGTVGVSCDSCHEKGWRENCTFCHGGTDGTTGAPPRDISGEIIPELLSFPAHTAHVSTHWHEAYDCTQCHTKPTNVLSVGHIFVDDSTAGEAEVKFSSGLSGSGSYNRSDGCSNLYCHGTGQADNGSVLHVLEALSCTSCHPDVSSGRDAWDEMSGAHEDHLREGAVCSECHGATVSSTQDIVDPALHVNGSVDIELHTGVTWSPSSQTCNGQCHIGSEDENHQYEDWD